MELKAIIQEILFTSKQAQVKIVLLIDIIIILIIGQKPYLDLMQFQ